MKPRMLMQVRRIWASIVALNFFSGSKSKQLAKRRLFKLLSDGSSILQNRSGLNVFG
jgi:hypothetical protein